MTIAKARVAWAEGPRGLLLLPVIGAAIGGAAILISDRGVADRPALSALILAAATAAGLAPLRYGLPVAVAIAFFEGFMADFAGDAALLWNEVFIALLVARSLWQRPPTRVEGLVAAAFAALFFGYLASGTKPLAVFWGAKVLLTSAIAAWAIARMRGLGRREWLATYHGLATGVAASFVLAAWQRHEGVAGLLDRGISQDRVRTLGGALRVFAGFTTSSPFAYTLAVALLCWLGLALSRRDRAIALGTAWLPMCAVVGLVWAHNRLTPLALGLAVVAVAGLETLGRRSSALWVAIPAIAAGAVAVGFLFQHWSTAPSATFRTRLWEEYRHELSPLGAGPASAGSAYGRARLRRWLPPLRFGAPWNYSDDGGRPVYGTGTTATVLLAAGDADTRPPLTLRAEAASALRPRVLVVRLDGRVLFSGRVATDRYRPIQVGLPPGRTPALLAVEPQPPTPRDYLGRRATAIRLRSPLVVGVPRARTPTLRVYQRMWERTVDLQRNVRLPPAGLVDNQYLSWVFQYGLFGGGLCAAWLGALLLPLGRRIQPRSLGIASAFCGVFLIAAAVGVNVWEESPADLLAAVIFGLTFAGSGSRKYESGAVQVN